MAKMAKMVTVFVTTPLAMLLGFWAYGGPHGPRLLSAPVVELLLDVRPDRYQAALWRNCQLTDMYPSRSISTSLA
jgi:hypothetical protein